MVISFSKLGNHGRVGNQLFQVCSTLGLAEKYGAQAVFPAWEHEGAFETPLPHGQMQARQIKEEHFHYYDWNLKEDCDILGYLQSYKYFPKENPFVFTRDFAKRAKSNYEHVFEKPTISIHIRRGDYVNHALYYQVPITWFIQALISIPDWKEHNVIVFSDDMPYAKIHFESLPNVFFSEHKTPMQDVCLMSQCDNHILSNSSLSWWGAYLSKQKNVIHPTEMFRGAFAKNSIKDYWPENWKALPESKIDLKDCTFTIPVFHDHPDRKKNLDLSVCMLQQSFDTNIIVGEQGSKQFGYMSKHAKYIWFDYKHFHRTKMLNEMAMMANTDIIVNWDADIILPPLQVYLTCEMIRNGSDMVFPYDGRFARMNRMQWFKQVEKFLDIGIIRDSKLSGKRGREIPENSVGGAVFFKKESFIEGGMENENMISFGPEDCERNDRFKILGYNVERTGGCLYHMDHWCGTNSNTLNPFFKANHRELEKIRPMDKEQLTNYVRSWSWYHKYTGDYYGQISEGAIQSAKEVFKVLKGLKINPKTVIDIGCGVGEWNNGIKGYVGLDWNVPKKALLIPKENYINFDLEKDQYLVTNQERFDLCLCLEVAEHLSPERAEPLINTLCTLSDRVLFSAAIPYQGGHGHVNEQFQSYWAELFAKHGFYPKHNIRELIFDNESIDLYYRQNIVLYEKGAKGKVVDFVHPKYYIEIAGHLTNSLKALQ